MEALMLGRTRYLKKHPLLWVLLGFGCCALLTLGGIVQAAHMHADGRLGHSDCALCHTAHQGIQSAHYPVLPCIVMVVTLVAIARRTQRIRSYFLFSLFTRPPPAQTAIA
jgi:hypothetical protein